MMMIWSISQPVVMFFVGIVVPKYYYVARDYIQAERDNPGGLHRLPTSEGTDDNYFLWGQSVYLVMKLLGNIKTKK